MGCNAHAPEQHRDGKEPWCKNCGLTANFRKPKSVFDKNTKVVLEEPKLDMEFTKDKDLEQCVAEALGSASACWTNLEGAGDFLSDSALDIHQQLMKRIRQEMA